MIIVLSRKFYPKTTISNYYGAKKTYYKSKTINKHDQKKVNVDIYIQKEPSILWIYICYGEELWRTYFYYKNEITPTIRRGVSNRHRTSYFGNEVYKILKEYLHDNPSWNM